MASYSWHKMSRQLRKKSFVPGEGSDHEVLYLVINGKEVGLNVKISSHSADVGNDLQSKIARDLRMPGASFLGQYVACHKNLADYVPFLIAKGVLPEGFALR